MKFFVILFLTFISIDSLKFEHSQVSFLKTRDVFRNFYVCGENLFFLCYWDGGDDESLFAYSVKLGESGTQKGVNQILNYTKSGRRYTKVDLIEDEQSFYVLAAFWDRNENISTITLFEKKKNSPLNTPFEIIIEYDAKFQFQKLYYGHVTNNHLYVVSFTDFIHTEIVCFLDFDIKKKTVFRRNEQGLRGSTFGYDNKVLISIAGRGKNNSLMIWNEDHSTKAIIDSFYATKYVINNEELYIRNGYNGQKYVKIDHDYNIDNIDYPMTEGIVLGDFLFYQDGAYDVYSYNLKDGSSKRIFKGYSYQNPNFVCNMFASKKHVYFNVQEGYGLSCGKGNTVYKIKEDGLSSEKVVRFWVGNETQSELVDNTGVYDICVTDTDMIYATGSCVHKIGERVCGYDDPNKTLLVGIDPETKKFSLIDAPCTQPAFCDSLRTTLTCVGDFAYYTSNFGTKDKMNVIKDLYMVKVVE